jgi:hypothetical protein
MIEVLEHFFSDLSLFFSSYFSAPVLFLVSVHIIWDFRSVSKGVKSNFAQIF